MNKLLIFAASLFVQIVAHGLHSGRATVQLSIDDSIYSIELVGDTIVQLPVTKTPPEIHISTNSKEFKTAVVSKGQGECVRKIDLFYGI